MDQRKFIPLAGLYNRTHTCFAVINPTSPQEVPYFALNDTLVSSFSLPLSCDHKQGSCWQIWYVTHNFTFIVTLSLYANISPILTGTFKAPYYHQTDYVRQLFFSSIRVESEHQAFFTFQDQHSSINMMSACLRACLGYPETWMFKRLLRGNRGY